jgi:uncharacterized membrane protein (UPF0127 family)
MPLRLPVSSFVLSLSLLGCDAPPVEPATAQRPGAMAVASSTAATSASARPSARSERCIKPTPATPERTQPPGPDPRCPDDPGPKPALALATVRFPEASEPNLEVGVELARTDAERERGLMYRKSLGEGRGMLFVFERERTLTFWMHNTCIPLDMIFLAKDGTIVGIEESTPTMSDDTFSPGCPASYVLEVDAGWSRKHGVRAGMKVALPPP